MPDKSGYLDIDSLHLFFPIFVFREYYGILWRKIIFILQKELLWLFHFQGTK